MFSTTPKIGTLTEGSKNIFIAFIASATATSCGVVTIIAPVKGTV